MTALSPTDLQAEIGHYTYRPDWTLAVDVDPHEGPVLWVIADVVDGYQPDSTTRLRVRSLIPPMSDRAAFQVWLLWRLGQIEWHECREMLRYDGALVADPHVVLEHPDPPAAAVPRAGLEPAPPA